MAKGLYRHDRRRAGHHHHALLLLLAVLAGGEDERVDSAAHPLLEAPEEASAEIGRIRLDTYLGMGLSNLISLFIIVTTAATLHVHGTTDIQTSAQVAEALRPIAGVFPFAIFAAGIIGIGLLAVPVLAGSAAYALGEALGWTTGLDRQPLEAKAFYGTIAVATVVGILINGRAREALPDERGGNRYVRPKATRATLRLYQGSG